MPQISLVKISKCYQAGGSRSVVLNALDFSLEQGSFALITGKSGSGKSTLLNLIAGLDRPDSGSISIDSTNISKFSPDQLAEFRLRKVGLVFQFFNFLPTLTVEENISLPAYLAGERPAAAALRCAELLEALGIGSIKKRYPHEISGGELQRSAVARALINRPLIVLADEPTGNLDDQNSDRVFELLRELTKQHKTTLIMASHETDFTRRADLALELKNGALHERV